MIEFDRSMCAATFKNDHKDFGNLKIINMKNIMSIHEVSFNYIISINNINVIMNGYK